MGYYPLNMGHFLLGVSITYSLYVAKLL
jgi:hypothetical protein